MAWNVRAVQGRWSRSIKQYALGAALLAVFLVGRVPIHRFRLLCYRNVFGVSVGRHAVFHWRTVFFKPSGIAVGARSVIGNDCFLDGRRGVRIGDDVNIGGHVQIFTLEHDPQDVGFGVRGGEVRIGNRAWVASRATVLPGVQIGEGAVVAAGAVVSRDVAPFEIVAGVPARVVGRRRNDLSYHLGFHLPFQ